MPDLKLSVIQQVEIAGKGLARNVTLLLMGDDLQSPIWGRNAP